MTRTIFLVALFATQLFTENVFSALPPKNVLPTIDAKSALEKLTGVSSVQKKLLPEERALQLARESRDQKNYVLAIKRYNYILKNFSKTKQATLALMDKSAIYNKMGFEKPAAYNMKKAKMISAVNTQLQKNNGSTKK